MDDTRFDALSRAVGRNRSRRGVLRTLAATAAAVALGRTAAGPAAAQTGWLDLGDPCWYDVQCAEGGMCQYIAQTGDDRCCTGEGGRCGGDHMCCGDLVCGAGDMNGAFCQRPEAACDSYGCDCAPRDPWSCAAGLTCCAVQSGFVCVSDGECAPAPCNGPGCDCVDAPGACADGLICCGSGLPGLDGTCQATADCYPEAAACTGWGCDCDFHLAQPCDVGLMCCAVAGRFICAAGDACAG